jgi:hypothetical protein
MVYINHIMSRKYEPPFRKNDSSTNRFSNNSHNSHNSGSFMNERPVINTSLPTKNSTSGKSSVLQDDDFPAFPSKATNRTTTVTSASDLPKRATFAQLATEWTRKMQEEKEKEKAEAEAEAARQELKKKNEDKALIESIKRMNIGTGHRNKRSHSQILDIGCNLSDNSENEQYDSQDDQHYEDDVDEEEEEEEDADALWNYRKNKNEMY